MIACDDKVVARTRFNALHVARFKGIPATNRTIEFDQIHIWRLQDGLVAESWACADEVSGLRQWASPCREGPVSREGIIAGCCEPWSA